MSTTTNLGLFKHDNPATNTNAFDIKGALNDNWDKIDENAGDVNQSLQQQATTISNINTNLNAEITNRQTAVADLQTQINSVASGSPAGVYSTVSALTTADPDHSKIYVVSADGHWYYYANSQWNDGGVYQATAIEDSSITIPKLENQIVNDLYDKSPNLFNKNDIQLNKDLITWSTSINTANCSYNKDGWFVSNIIEVEPNQIIKCYINNNNNLVAFSVGNIIFFDENGDYVSSSANQNTFTIPQNVKYVMFSKNDMTIIDNIMITLDTYDITNGFLNYGYISKVIKKDELKEELENYVKITDKTYIIFSFDAFRPDEDDLRYVIMRNNKFPCVIALSQTILSYPLSMETYYRLIRDNVELSVYAGVGERPSSYYDPTEEEEWDDWVTDLVNGLKESSGIFEPIMYSCQNATTGPNQEKAIKNNGFLLSRANTIYNNDGTYYTPSTPDDFLIDGLNSNILPSYGIKKSTLVSEITSLIDYAMAQHKSLMFLTHYVLPENEAGEYDAIDTTFTSIVNYVKQKQDEGLLEVVSPSQFYNIYKPGEKADYKEKKRIQLRTNFDFNNL